MSAEFANFFAASTGAAAALAGLLFVAISVAPEQTVARSASAERQAVAASSFTALVNAFFISLAALIPGLNLGSVVLVMSILALVHTLSMGWTLARGSRRPLAMLRRMLLVLAGVVVYGFQLRDGMDLLAAPEAAGPLYVLAIILLSVYGIGLLRAWELLGARRQGLVGWLSPLRNQNDADSPASTDDVVPPKPERTR